MLFSGEWAWVKPNNLALALDMSLNIYNSMEKGLKTISQKV